MVVIEPISILVRAAMPRHLDPLRGGRTLVIGEVHAISIRISLTLDRASPYITGAFKLFFSLALGLT